MNAATHHQFSNFACLLLAACGLLLASATAQAEAVRWDQETVRSVLQVEIQRAEQLARSAPVVTGVEQHNALQLPPITIRQRDRIWKETGPDTADKQLAD